MYVCMCICMWARAPPNLRPHFCKVLLATNKACNNCTCSRLELILHELQLLRDRRPARHTNEHCDREHDGGVAFEAAVAEARQARSGQWNAARGRARRARKVGKEGLLRLRSVQCLRHWAES